MLLRLVASMVGALRLAIVNEGLKLVATIPAFVDVAGRLSLPPEPLADWTGAVGRQGYPIEFEYDDLEHQVQLVAGTVHHTLAVVAGDEAPGEDAVDESEQRAILRIPAGRLKVALDRLAPVQALVVAGGMPAETALDLDADGRLTLVTTDTVRMAMVDLPDARVDGADLSGRSWVFRNADLKVMAAVLNGKTRAGTDVSLALGEKTWTAWWSHYVMTAPYSERTFPKWRSVRPQSYTNTIEVDGAELHERLQMLAKVADDNRAAVRFRWNGSTEAIMAAGNGEAGTETTATLGLTWRTRAAPADTELVMSARYLEPLVKRLGHGPLLFCFTAAALPAMVRSAGNELGVEYLQMPINL